MSGHSHTLLCIFYCPERKGQPWNTNEKFPTPRDLHRRHREEDKRK